MPGVEEYGQLTLFDAGPNLTEIREESEEMARAIRAPRTHEEYDKQWRAFEAWTRGAGKEALPASADTLKLYITTRLKSGVKISTALLALAAVAFHHRAKGKEPPDRGPARKVINGEQRRRQEQPRQAAALTPEQLRRICVKLARQDGPAAARDRAVLLLAFGTALRRSNVAALQLRDVAIERKGVVVRVRSSKTDQAGMGARLSVFRGKRPETCPARALRSWLDKRGDAQGPLFTQCKSGGVQLTPLCGATVNQILKDGVKSIGLDPKAYSAHSLRAGFVTAADNAGSGTLAIMETTGHATVEMVRRYLRNAQPFARNPIPKVL